MKPFLIILSSVFLLIMLFFGLKLFNKESIASTPTTSNLYEMTDSVNLTMDEAPIIIEKTFEEKRLETFIDVADYNNPSTRKFALQIANKFPGEHNIKQVCAIYNELNTKWKYVSDPAGEEYFSKASETINDEFSGDCDDFAVLMCSTLRAIGFRTRITTAVNEESGHAFCEVLLEEEPKEIRKQINYQFSSGLQDLFGESEVKEINYRTNPNENGIWLNLDWSSKYPGGEYYKYTSYTIYDLQEKKIIKSSNDD